MIHKKYCVKCKSISRLGPKPYSIAKSKNGDYVGYYICNPCNTLRVKKYRDSKIGNINTRKANKKSVFKHKAKQLTRYKVRGAIISGKLVRPDSCSKCNKKEKYIEGHHSDYEKPLSVTWLCKVCHSALHNV